MLITILYILAKGRKNGWSILSLISIMWQTNSPPPEWMKGAVDERTNIRQFKINQLSIYIISYIFNFSNYI